MQYTISQIAQIINASVTVQSNDIIEHLLTDSRRLVTPETSLFFALNGERRSGNDYIKELYNAGVKYFVTDENIEASKFEHAVFLKVNNVLVALQTLAAHHRILFQYPVIGITGSNGKTIVKEWLFQLLHNDFNIVRSPRSYNSQIGVPLSVWQMSSENNLAIFEAGISETHEMQKLENIIKPKIALFTNIGTAHDAGFESQEQKAKEKSILADNGDVIIYNADDELLLKSLADKKGKHITYGTSHNALIKTSVKEGAKESVISVLYNNKNFSFTVPYADAASIQNILCCITTLLYFGYDENMIAERLKHLQPVALRMQLQKGVNNTYILNDTYSNDLVSLNIALTYLKQQAAGKRTTVVLTAFADNNIATYDSAIALLNQNKVNKLIAIGENFEEYLKANHNKFKGAIFQFRTVRHLLRTLTTHDFKDEFILLKGARKFELERLGEMLEYKIHQTVLEINLSAVTHNLKTYQKLLKPETKMMAMVKAFGYGSGGSEVAKLLQFNKVDYLAVAYADEGIELRKAGISLPIVVMNVDEAGINAMVDYSLEPVIYSFNLLTAFHNYILQQGINGFAIHIKFDTGMHRLGFETKDLSDLTAFFSHHKQLIVRSAFTHFAASDEAQYDGFTKQQADNFLNCCNALEAATGYHFIKHASNSAGISRHTNLQFDMVRLGIGLYGIDSNPQLQKKLHIAASLKTTIAQIRTVKAGETVGYSRKGIVSSDRKIATVRIGYADGYSRKNSNGKGYMYVKNKRVPVIGNVCMDMTMIDITETENVNEGDVVEIFGEHITIQQLAESMETISYEVLTGISQRVTRVYVDE